MNAVGLLPLLVAVALAAVLPLADVNPRLDTHLTRIARRYFSRYVTADAPVRSRQLRAAYVDETYRSYAAKTYLLAALLALSGAIVGVYVVGGVLLILPTVGEFVQSLPSAISGTLGNPELEPELTDLQVFAIVTAGGVVTGTAAGAGAYWWRWQAPKNRAEVRRRGINEGLPRTVAFVYALSRGGMAVPELLRTLADNRGVYGHGADELSVAVREMDLFGRDVVTAVRNVSERTPSEEFKTFTENFASVLQSGQELPAFLRDQYDRYRDEARERQDEVIELLATVAEAYVTILVAGTLFLMTILLVFGLTTTQTIGFLRMLAYAGIPLANLMFVIYLDGKLDVLGVARGTDVGGLAEDLDDHRAAVDPADVTLRDGDSGSAGPSPARSDGGEPATRGPVRGSDTDENRQTLALYDRFERVKDVAGDPVGAVVRNPTRLLYVTVPIGLVWVALAVPGATGGDGFRIRALDDALIQAFLFVVGSFAVVWELYSRRVRRMEAALPELLDRLASLNQAGMSVVESLDRVRETDLGRLSVEVDRIWRDVEYGANVDDALRRFGLRVRTTATTRVVTLLTNALRASGSVAPVLRIAGEQAESELRLRRRRRQQMLTYLVVIYISFAVFLVIIVAVQEVLVPSLPTNVPVPSDDQTTRLGVNAGEFARFADVDKAAYTLVFFHTALIQAVLSGFVGGQLGEGSLKDGAKHAAAMLAVAYLAFVLLSSPVAQVSFADQPAPDDAVVVDSVSLTEGGFVVLHANTPDGRVVGTSAYLEPGTHEDVSIDLDRSYGGRVQLHAVPYLDPDDDEAFAPGTDRPYTADGEPVSVAATVRAGDQGDLRPPDRRVTAATDRPVPLPDAGA